MMSSFTQAKKADGFLKIRLSTLEKFEVLDYSDGFCIKQKSWI